MVRKVEIKDRYDEIQILDKKYKLDVTNYDFIKKCQTYIDELIELIKKNKDSNDIDEILETSKEIINFALDNNYNEIWELCNHNFKNLMNVIETISESIRDGMTDKERKYV